MTIQRGVPPTLSSQRDRPRSPNEALEPARAPARPKGVKEAKPPNRKVHGVVRVLSGLLTLAFVGLAVAAGSALLLRHEAEREGPLEVTRAVAIPKGLSRDQIAERLEKEGVIRSTWTFVLASMAGEFMGERQGQSLKFGDYEFKKAASVQEVLNTIIDGKSILAKLAVPEGLTSQAIVEKIKADDGLSGEVAAVPGEGVLFPDTYRFSKGMSRQELVDQMVAKQKEILQAAWEKRQEGLPLKTPEEALVLASIVEKETGRADERDKVAAVFVNRLKKNMPLQSDPTIRYGLDGGAAQWGKPILQSEIEAKNTHNTYQFKGLPPTPICNPGRASIEAVLSPAKTSDIYFVADGNGGHVFSDNLKAHNAAVEKWRKVEKEIRAAEKERAKADAATAATPPAPPPAAGATDSPATAPAKADAKAEAAAAAAPIKIETKQQPGQRAVVKTVPPPDAKAIPSPVAEQAAPAPAAAAAVTAATPAAGAKPSPVKTVPSATPDAGKTAAAPAANKGPVKTVPAESAPAEAEEEAPAAAAAAAPAAEASTVPLPVRKPKKLN